MGTNKQQGQSLDAKEIEADRARQRKRREQLNNKRQAERERQEEIQSKLRNRARKAAKKAHQKSIWKEHSENIIFGTVVAVLVLFVIYAKYFGKGSSNRTVPIFNEEWFASVNEGSNSFSVGANDFFSAMTMGEAARVMANGISRTKGIAQCKPFDGSIELKDEFDFTKEHPECFRGIFDQKKCSSAFALSAASTISDRLCLATGGDDKFVASVQHPLSCETRRANGCDGGFLTNTLDLAMGQGIASAECLPYNPDDGVTCDKAKLKECARRKIKNYCYRESVEDIKREIQTNGPVISFVAATREFLTYTGGIYDVEETEYAVAGGNQMVKIVGWGEEDGVGFWIIENFWGTSWGNGGFGKVKIGLENSYLDNKGVAVDVLINA